MSLGEVGYRIKLTAAGVIERIRINNGWSPSPEYVECSPTRLFDRRLAETKWPEDLVSAIASIQYGRLPLFDYTDLEIGCPINWHRDPLTNTDSPQRRFGKSINYRDSSTVGDIKVLWELGRQQYLVPIAAEYYVNRNQICLDVIAETLRSWLDQNPFGFGIHWCSSLEVAIRGISWSIAHELLIAAGLTKGIFDLNVDSSVLKKHIFQHAVFVRGHLSLYSSANNHLLGELTGLNTICTTFDFGDESQVWSDYSWRMILQEVELQIHEDGVNKEQAIYYHCWVLEYLLVNYLLAIRTGREIPDFYVDTLTRMAQFIDDISPSDGVPPQIGDADDGVAVRFSETKSSFPRDMIETVDVLSGSLDPSLCGSKAFFYCQMMEPTAQKKPSPVKIADYPRLYKEGGYAVLGAQNFHVVFDCGSLGYTALAAHGHADMLNICLAIDGDWWIVDPGTYVYHSDSLWRNYFRGSKAHNVINVNGKDQSTIGGPFMWVHHAQHHFEGIREKNGYQVTAGWHNGYVSQGVPKVARKIMVDSTREILEIHDELECEQSAQLSLHTHFAPGIAVQRRTGSTLLLSRSDSALRLKVELPEFTNVTCFEGDEDEVLGWYSPCLGKKEPCLTIRASRVSNTTIRLVSRIRVLRPD